MPRKSAESLSVVTGLPGQRLQPPRRLSKEAADVWREVVGCRPHDWFGADCAPLLEALCRTVIVHRVVSAKVAAFDVKTLGDPKAVAAYDALTRMQERQARVMASLATKLRLTPQSRYSPQVAASASKKVRGARPWEA